MSTQPMPGRHEAGAFGWLRGASHRGSAGELQALLALLRVRLRLRAVFFLGTFPPARRASLRPMAIACLRLVTFFPERPDLSVPRFRSCIARSTFSDAFSPYFGIFTTSRTHRAKAVPGVPQSLPFAHRLLAHSTKTA
jgi:hypothetical protein